MSSDKIPIPRVKNAPQEKHFKYKVIEQKALLENEGIEVSQDFMIDLKKYGWKGEE